MKKTPVRKSDTRTMLLDAAKKMLRRGGYSGLSTRDVAVEAVDLFPE